MLKALWISQAHRGLLMQDLGRSSQLRPSFLKSHFLQIPCWAGFPSATHSAPCSLDFPFYAGAASLRLPALPRLNFGLNFLGYINLLLPFSYGLN